jgi:hypothetical protein
VYSGFINSKRTLPAVGVHQRFDSAAYRLVAPQMQRQRFPTRRQIIGFEGVNGPDGLKAKSPGQHEPGHLYNPQTDVGDIPGLIEAHYGTLVAALRRGDLVRAAFDAAWLAHYICDGMTPAHHFPLDAELAAYGADYASKPHRYKHAVVVRGPTTAQTIKTSWALWGGKGLLSTHFNFEMGVATALVGRRIRTRLDAATVEQARRSGPVAYFKQQAQDIASLQMYERFYAQGWSADMAQLVVRRLAPQTVQAIAVVWLLAYQEAGLPVAAQLETAPH